MIQLFIKGGPIMWPILLTSIVAVAVVIDRIVFMIREHQSRQPEIVEQLLFQVETGAWDEARKTGAGTNDFVARVLTYALSHRERSLSHAVLHAASQELKRFNRGLPVLDTIITLAPLLGLLGTVIGMIQSFGLLGASELEAPTAITGGIAEALIATAFGLGVAITALIPFNYLNAKLEEARREIEDATTQLELMLVGHAPESLAEKK